MIIERTAPSPSGFLHLGHAFSALTAFNNACRQKGLFKLRIDNIDYTRCNKKFEVQILSVLSWLGISWDSVVKQTNHLQNYRTALKKLEEKGLTYRCACTRKDIEKALEAPHTKNSSDSKSSQPQIYPGTCRNAKHESIHTCTRLDVRKAISHLQNKQLCFNEIGLGPTGENGLQVITDEILTEKIGDIVLARKDIGTSYNLAVVIDDHIQEVTNVTRGNDLFLVTPIQVLLQALLGLRTPCYNHHKLIIDHTGRRLAKRNRSKSLFELREEGASVSDIRNIIGISHYND